MPDIKTSEDLEEEKNLGGRPPHVPTEENRKNVKNLSGLGVTEEQIAKYIGIGRKTLDKYYSDDLELGRLEANVTISKSLFQSAREGNTTAQIFWLKTRMGWRETNRIEQEITGQDGGPIAIANAYDLPPQESFEEWQKRRAKEL